METTDKKRRNRQPKYTPEERLARRRASRKKYIEKYPQRVAKSTALQNERRRRLYDSLYVVIEKEFRQALDELLAQTGLTASQLCIGAVEEKYSVILSKKT